MIHVCQIPHDGPPKVWEAHCLTALFSHCEDESEIEFDTIGQAINHGMQYAVTASDPFKLFAFMHWNTNAPERMSALREIARRYQDDVVGIATYDPKRKMFHILDGLALYDERKQLLLIGSNHFEAPSLCFAVMLAQVILGPQMPIERKVPMVVY